MTLTKKHASKIKADPDLDIKIENAQTAFKS